MIICALWKFRARKVSTPGPYPASAHARRDGSCLTTNHSADEAVQCAITGKGRGWILREVTTPNVFQWIQMIN